MCVNWKCTAQMGSAPSSSRVSTINVRQEKLSCEGCEKLKDSEIRVGELGKALESSQQRCLEVKAQYSQASDELEMLKEQLEQLNKQLANSRAHSASERATRQVYASTITD